MAVAKRKSAKKPPVIVRRSRIHGRGVYATRKIRTGEKIIEYTGRPIPKGEENADKYNDDLKKEAHTFLFYIDRNLTIDATYNGSAAKWINHSCDPNCETVIQNRRVYIKALRMIQKGEELTYDYALFSRDKWKRNYWQRYACRCGTRKCRGVILKRPHPPRAQVLAWRKKYLARLDTQKPKN